ncbi:MAG: peptidylprolyl isomerase [Deltaproteobacteria bacterium]|nr:peptidylprolyl isomerase [Deltaproteobacteria bacterium]
MKIAPNTVVAMNYELRLGDDDEVIDASSDGEFFFLVGHHNIVPGLESELLGLAKGDKRKISVAPEQGYGTRDESKVIALPRSALPKDFVIEIGLPLELEDQQGNAFPVWIAGTHEDDVVLDGNHPLADETLHFAIEIVEVRQASAEELSHGHVHGPGGHHH